MTSMLFSVSMCPMVPPTRSGCPKRSRSFEKSIAGDPGRGWGPGVGGGCGNPFGLPSAKAGACRPALRALGLADFRSRLRPPGPARGRKRVALLLGARFLDVLGHHVLVRGVPVGDLLELAALDLPDLHEPAALVVLRRDLERRHQAAEREVRDLLEALLDVVAGDLAARLGLERVADGLHVQGPDE